MRAALAGLPEQEGTDTTTILWLRVFYVSQILPLTGAAWALLLERQFRTVEWQVTSLLASQLSYERHP